MIRSIGKVVATRPGAPGRKCRRGSLSLSMCQWWSRLFRASRELPGSQVLIWILPAWCTTRIFIERKNCTAPDQMAKYHIAHGD